MCAAALLIMCYSLYRRLREERCHATISGKMAPEMHRIEIPMDREGA